MSAGHRQRGPQEGHSTMEEGEEMRDEENEERTRGGFEQRGRRREKGTDDEVDEKKIVEGQMRIGGAKEVPMLRFLSCFQFVGDVQIGDKEGVGWVGRGGVVVVVTEEWQRGEVDRRNNWSWGVQSVGKS